MSPSRLKEHLVNGGRIERIGSRYRLTVPPTSARNYVDAQLDDYNHVLPRHFTNLPPQCLMVRARFSHQQIKGTAGFGYWNHPFSREGSVIAPPCNLWYFHSSSESDLRVARGVPGYGFKASMLNSNCIPRVIVSIGSVVFNASMKVPFLSKWLMAAARTAVNTTEAMIHSDMTEWHEYRIRWQSSTAVFTMDGKEVLRTSHPPQTALGFAAWIDNYRASAGGDHYKFAYVNVEHEQWMELEIIEDHE